MAFKLYAFDEYWNGQITMSLVITFVAPQLDGTQISWPITVTNKVIVNSCRYTSIHKNMYVAYNSLDSANNTWFTVYDNKPMPEITLWAVSNNFYDNDAAYNKTYPFSAYCGQKRFEITAV